MKRLVSAVAFSLILGGASVALGQNPGESTYKAKCAVCHGPDGGGKTMMGEKLKARDLRLPEVQKQTDADLTLIICKGKEKMPAYDGKLTKEQISQLVGFIRELAKKH
ncbi:MAG TPA: c-type cytochrome [Candidatus Acidoferrales bacterium]|nr:c-type cytochrome [Candidatus Acidoferrales bacterium]